MSVAAAAQYLDVSIWTVNRLVTSGRLRAVTVGTRRKLRPADIDEYLRAS